MKILHISAVDGQTGAGVAAARIHIGLLGRGISSRFCVAYPSVGLTNAFTPLLSPIGRVSRTIRQKFSARLLASYAHGYDYVLSTGLVGHDIRRIVAAECPDIVHLHWIAGDSFRLDTLAGISVPIIWRLSDMWPFCGVAHLEPDPSNYAHPPLKSNAWGLLPRSLSEYMRLRKQRIYATLPSLNLTAPSRWLLSETRRSALLGDRPIELIRTSCDTHVFYPRSRNVCREALGLPADAKLVLVGATSMGTRWKGGDLFVEAMLNLISSGRLSGLRVVTFGKDPIEGAELSDTVPIDHFGQVRDARLMALLYNASDVFVAPSRMENLANTVLESLACGTPVAAFNIGGMPDLIEHQVNGCLAPPFNTRSLADGIAWLLEQAGNELVRQNARNKIVAEFSLDQEIDGYMALYEKVLQARSRCASQRECIGAV